MTSRHARSPRTKSHTPRTVQRCGTSSRPEQHKLPHPVPVVAVWELARDDKAPETRTGRTGLAAVQSIISFSPVDWTVWFCSLIENAWPMKMQLVPRMSWPVVHAVITCGDPWS